MRKFLFVSLMALALGGCSYQVSYDSETGFDSGSMNEPMEGNGYIEGSLAYPSEGIPDNLMVCTENERGSSCGIYQTLEGDEYTYGIGYRIEVPAGSYKVFSKTEVSGAPDVIGGYTACGDANDCEDHVLLMVDVVEGETVTGIDLEDFQAEFF